MVWEKAKAVLKESLGESIYNLWIEPLECIHADAENIHLACPDRFYRAHLTRNHLSLVQEKINQLSTVPCKVTLCDKGGSASCRKAQRTASAAAYSRTPLRRPFSASPIYL